MENRSDTLILAPTRMTISMMLFMMRLWWVLMQELANWLILVLGKHYTLFCINIGMLNPKL